MTFHTINTTRNGERLFSLSERMPNIFYSYPSYSFLVKVMQVGIKELPDELKLPSDEPFDGLFSSRIRSALVEEFISDPYHVYRPSELSELLDTTFPTLRSHFSNLVKSNLIIKDSRDWGRPKYKVNFNSKRLIALSILMDAINDDRDGTNTMDRSIISYYNDHLTKIYNDVQGTFYQINIQADHINKLTVNGQNEKYPITISEGSA